MTARLVIAGTSSGAGKTSIACGLIGALRSAGHVVQACKVGPDYIDPSYHSLASGRPGRNLDAFIAGPDLIAPLLANAVRPLEFRDVPTGAATPDPVASSREADLLVIEGVMGLFDGASGRGELASTAHIAKLTDSPVVLVVDATAQSRSAAAVVHGFRSFDPDVQIAGVILNRVGSEHHEALLRDAIEPLGVPVLGAVRRSDRLATPERHLGLIPASEREAAAKGALDALAVAIAEHVEIEALVRLARSAPPLRATPWHTPGAADDRDRDSGTLPSGLDEAPVRIAVASGNAFSFHYRENLESLASLGAELVPFDPTRDESLPSGADALLLAGGFPEVYGEALAANVPLRGRVATAVRAGLPTVAECGGLLYLCDRLDDHAMCGVLAGDARMAGRLSLGYREATTVTDSPLAVAGTALRGHEFHYSTVDPSCGGGDGSLAAGPGAAFTLRARGRERREGFATATLSASYLHIHWAAFPDAPRRLVAAARAHAARATPAAASVSLPR